MNLKDAICSVIIATGKVTSPIPVSQSTQSVIIERVENFPANLKLFDTAKAGVEVSLVPSGVRVAKIHAGKAFAWAGVRPGDLVKAVGETKIETLNDFRRSVRRAFVEQQRTTIQLKRGGKILTVPVVF